MKPFRILLAFSAMAFSSAHAEVVADSVANFPTTKDQGVNGWTYGYRAVDQDADDLNTYDPEADFVAFDEADGWIWNGTAWDWGDGNVPWTVINATGGHPNGPNNGEEQWAVRRWTATVGPKPLAVSWHLHKNNTNGNGTSVSVNLNGIQVDYGAVEGSDDVGIDQTVYVNVNPGDHIDISLTPVGPTDDRLDGSDGSAWSAVIDDTIPANPMQPDGTPFVAVSGEDSDSDGLPDAWEMIYAEDLATLAGNADFDGDGLTEAQEFEAGIDPTDADSDDDGLTDGAEIAGGTNPRNADTNGNGLTDAQELAVDDIVAAKIGDSIEDFGEDQGPAWFNGFRNYTADGGGEDYNADTDFEAFSTDGGWTWTGDQWDWADGNVPWTAIGSESLHPNGINNSNEHWAIRRWVASEITEPTPLSIYWNVRKENLNGGGISGSLNINGKQAAKATVPGGDDVGATGIHYINAVPGDIIDLGLTPEGPSDGRADGSDGSLSWMIVSTHIPENARQADGTLFVPSTGDDTDGDGLPDAWEQQYFPDNLAALATGSDNDSDGLLDEDEFALNSDPTVADTDGDGLPDGAERDDGEFVDASKAGSSPLKADTDTDGISDSDEANGDPATNPSKADSDGDGFSDPEELAQGFDPNDASNNPFAGLIAESVSEFSGTQGENGWFNGFRNLGDAPEEASVDYDPEADFIAFDEADGWTWSGTAWDWADGNVPWTTINATGGHPNGTNNGNEEWAIRRWVADELTDSTPLGIVYHLHATNTNGTGTSVQLHINGEHKDTLTVAGNDAEGETRTFYANVNPGDFIDLGLTPVGLDDDPSDGSDGSGYTLRVDSNIPENPTQPDGSTFVPLVLGDPHLSVPFRTPFGLLGDDPGVQTRTVTLKNSGSNQELSITAANLVGANAANYTNDLVTPLTLAPGASQDFIVTFDPQGSDGGFIASLEFTSNDENETTRRLDLNANIPDANKLVAWYKMDETDGTRLNDSSGNGYHGTYVAGDGSIELAQPSLAGGTAVGFAPGATAAYAEVASLPGFEAGFSISLWHQANADLADVAGLFAKGDGTAEPTLGDPYALAVANSELTWFGGGAQDIAEAGSVTAEQAQHVTVTYSPNDDGTNTVKVYLDGVLTETKEDSSEITDDRGPLQLGAVNGMFGYSGLLDDMQIYGRVLSDDEVGELQANPGQKLGGGNTPDPQPDSPFRTSLTDVSKSASGVSINSSLGNAATYDVEYSEDLISWDIIESGVTVSPYEDTDATRTANASGYYRIRE
ncbi:hypothetical protein N9V94_01675 [bacterium]|jgi:hypothetical protein|nr:hypothetical protein [bacterium]